MTASGVNDSKCKLKKKKSKCKLGENHKLIKVHLTVDKCIHSGEKPNQSTACGSALQSRSYQTIHKLLHTVKKA